MTENNDPAPVCGEDFCEECGDCLVCYGEDRCQVSEDGKHSWVRNAQCAKEDK